MDQLLGRLDEALKAGDVTDLTAIPTGFKLLDEVTGGGLHNGDLVLLGGPPGVGKTVAGLQMARNLARRGRPALFICYEHEEPVLATRLIALEAAEGGEGVPTGASISTLLLQGAEGQAGLADTLSADPGTAEAFERVQAYADRLTFIRASGSHTGLDEIERLIETAISDYDDLPVVVVDYLQKVPIRPEPATEAEKVTRTVEALKDLALTHHVPLLAISAVDAAGMEARRLRLHHLRGSSAVAFEADVVIMLNEKQKAVSKVHLAYDAVGAKRFRDWVVWSVEKNRGGPNLVDLEFEKDFANFRFDPEGGLVSERLVDERFDDEVY